MIESDEQRFHRLLLTYKDSPQVRCLNALVDSGANNVGSLLRGRGVGDLDFLSVDIDGLDYEVFEALDVRPRVICIEVNAGHDPDNELRLSRRTAQRNIGQPLAVFGKIADSKGYDLVCYTGNAFFVRRDVVAACSLRVLSCRQAYLDFLRHLDTPGREWLYLVNRGVVDPHFTFRNPHLSRKALGIHRHRSLWLTATHWLESWVHR